jgi:hypothetical protein
MELKSVMLLTRVQSVEVVDLPIRIRACCLRRKFQVVKCAVKICIQWSDK